MTSPDKKGIVVTCTMEGIVVEVLHNNLDVYLQPGTAFVSILDQESVTKCLTFFLNIRKQRAAFTWEFNIKSDNGPQELYFVGNLKDERITVIAGETPDTLKYFEKFMELNNEQVTSLRTIVKENVASKGVLEEKEIIITEISRLNNELVNAERELAKKNAQLNKLNNQLEKLVNKDDLTGLYNRRFFFYKVHEEITKAKKSGRHITLVMLDMNNFKNVNDTYGHDAGDKILRDFANLSKKILREHDYIFRIGGDEFVILLTDCKKEKAEKIVARLDRCFQKQNGVSLAYGIENIMIEENIVIDKYIKIIDDKMYRHKKNFKENNSFH